MTLRQGLALGLPFALACSLVAGSGDFEIVDGGTDALLDTGPDAARCASADDCTAREATTDCVGGACVVTACNEGFGDCDGLAATGCEVDLTTLDNCGACGDRCDLPSATEACMDGDCQIVSCAAGTEDCDGILDNGCEANLTSPGSCGNCSTVCMGDTPICDTSSGSASCAESCDPPGMLCDLSCVDTETDPLHCGGCDACGIPTRSTATCMDGTCGFTCDVGYRDCNAMIADGCEVELASNLLHCGACDAECVELNATQACTGGICVPACDSGFDDCNGNPSDGCETNVRTSDAHCGACDSPCPSGCVEGVCNPITDLSVGYAASCAVRADSSVWCWGSNERGQLGTGDHAPHGRPVRVVGVDGTGFLAASRVSTRGTGYTQTTSCALLLDQTLACWGNNIYGTVAVGDAVRSEQLVPRAVTSTDAAFDSRDFVWVEAGYEVACALDSEGDVWCWGRNVAGALGIPFSGAGAIGSRGSAERVSVGAPVAQIALGFQQVCARTVDGDVLCWGQNSNSELGTSGASRFTPMPTDPPIDDAIDIAVGNQHGCALRASGQTFCWGVGTNGRLGTGNTLGSTMPVRATELGDDGAELAAYNEGTFVTSTSGVHRVVGSNVAGTVGVGSAVANAITAVSPVGLGPTARIFTTSSSVGAIDGSRAWIWGLNYHGALADGAYVRESPTPIATSGITSVSLGEREGCVGTATDALCFGRNLFGQLGVGSMGFYGSNSTPALIAAISHPWMGEQFACGLSGGDAFCWGTNANGRVGTGSVGGNVLTPTSVMLAGFEDAVAAGGDGFACAIQDAPGNVYCWGKNQFGQLGQGTMGADVPMPGTAVVGIDDAVALFAMRYSMCALRDGGDLMCWGAGSSGQLGNGGTASSSVAVSVSLVENVLDVAGAETHMCAISRTDAAPTAPSGQVFCWGSNVEGAVGDPASSAGHPTPFGVPVLDAVTLGVGRQHTCALRATGELRCWGRNNEAQLGDGTRIQRNAPVVSHAISGNVVGLSKANSQRSHGQCAWRDDGTAVCWGLNVEGSLGGGEPLFIYAPQLLALW